MWHWTGSLLIYPSGPSPWCWEMLPPLVRIFSVGSPRGLFWVLGYSALTCYPWGKFWITTILASTAMQTTPRYMFTFFNIFSNFQNARDNTHQEKFSVLHVSCVVCNRRSNTHSPHSQIGPQTSRRDSQNSKSGVKCHAVKRDSSVNKHGGWCAGRNDDGAFWTPF